MKSKNIEDVKYYLNDVKHYSNSVLSGGIYDILAFSKDEAIRTIEREQKIHKLSNLNSASIYTFSKLRGYNLRKNKKREKLAIFVDRYKKTIIVSAKNVDFEENYMQYRNNSYNVSDEVQEVIDLVEKTTII